MRQSIVIPTKNDKMYVIPTKVGIQVIQVSVDSRLRGNDKMYVIPTKVGIHHDQAAVDSRLRGNDMESFRLNAIKLVSLPRE